MTQERIDELEAALDDAQHRVEQVEARERQLRVDLQMGKGNDAASQRFKEKAAALSKQVHELETVKTKNNFFFLKKIYTDSFFIINFYFLLFVGAGQV